MKIYRLREAKTNQLKKLLNNGNITEEQFQIADEFFKKYSAFENEIDWNRGLKITWDDLKAVIYKERNSESKTRKKIRKGLEGFEEGKDYLVLEQTGVLHIRRTRIIGITITKWKHLSIFVENPYLLRR